MMHLKCQDSNLTMSKGIVILFSKNPYEFIVKYRITNFRNSFLAKHTNLKMPKMTKTGTTICGVVFDGGVVVGADTRATGGDVVADKNCQKIHQLAPNMLCCGAGTAADCDKTTDMIGSQLQLLR